MSLYHLTDREIALKLARALREWRMSPRGAALTQVELSRKSGVGVTPLKRFEATGGATLKNLIAILRGLDLLDYLEDLVPDPTTPSPLEVLEAERARLREKERKRAPRRPKTDGPQAGSAAKAQNRGRG